MVIADYVRVVVGGHTVVQGVIHPCKTQSMPHIPTIKSLSFGVRVPIYQSAYYQNPYTKSKVFITPRVGPEDPIVLGLQSRNSWGLQDAPS